MLNYLRYNIQVLLYKLYYRSHIKGVMLLLGSLWLSNQWSLSKSNVNQMIITDPTKSNESKAQQVPLNSFLYQIFE
jgi:hypothetical protein